MSNRHWLRPRLYVTAADIGDGMVLRSSTPWPPAPEHDWVCASCGRLCLDEDGISGGYNLNSGFYCYDCHEPVALRGLVRQWQNVQIALDNAYFRYCRRFGKSVDVS